VPYTISQLKVKNFKCFDDKKFYEFNFIKDRNPTILSGPNGFGKTTFFDAIELIFTKKITRLNTDIEDKRTNLGKNILLNRADKNGYLVLTLKDENNNSITIVTIIDNQIKKLSIGESIKYSIIDGILNTDEEMEQYLLKHNDWKSSLQNFDKIRYSVDHFNVYYYVSQAESVHFLKNSITSRKDSMNVLLNTTTIDGYVDYILNEIIGKNRNKKNVIINDAINYIDASIETKIRTLKIKIQEANLSLQKIGYSQLLEYPVDVEPLVWDVKMPDFNNKTTKLDLNSSIFEIQALHNFVVNKEDYKIYVENEKVNKIINNKNMINDYIDFHQYIENGLIDKKRIEAIISNLNNLVNIYNYSSFFRNGLDITKFKKEDLFKLKELKDDLISVNVEEISELIDSIISMKKKLSKRQNMLNQLDKARTNLYQVKKELDIKSSNCPYCNHKFSNVEDLEKAFSYLSSTLSGEKNEESQKLEVLIQAVENKFRRDLNTVLSIVEGYDEHRIRELNEIIVKNKQFVRSENRIKDVEILYTYLSKSDSWHELGITEKTLEIERLMKEYLKDYRNPDFIDVMNKFNFNSISNKYRDILSVLQPKLKVKENVEQKIQYIQYQASIFKANEINTLRSEIKKYLVKRRKLNIIREKFDSLQKLYQSSINDYKNQILKKIRVPLLIYTGKILQDYQNGLGVFVNKDEMRFVSNGDAKHDILNTFSSGQLSGFVLAFLFSMNKQFIMKSIDDIGFILIDDPVQTMDDINISSLIEVLRNDFSNKQIIISTHETDKENYILYKFLKYNLKGQSFNVKERLYL
jgi:DNA repair protein SbcC/Rad50